MFIVKEIQTAAYLFASILFILSLGSLSSQESAKRGVFYGISWYDCCYFSNSIRSRC
jgi:NAD(P) transhydrogenase subunit beta